MVISILDALEKIKSIKCTDLCKIFSFLYQLINHMKINVLSNEDIERYESVLKDQSKDICCSNVYNLSVILQ